MCLNNVHIKAYYSVVTMNYSLTTVKQETHVVTTVRNVKSGSADGYWDY